MNKNVFLCFLFYMISFMFMFSTNNWFSFWISLELNSISFLMIIMTMYNKNSMESALNYFLIQAVSSLILILLLMSHNFMSNLFMMSTSLIIVVLLFKLGVAPLHNWFLPIAFNSKFFLLWLLLILQKLPYFISLYFISSMAPLYFMFLCLNVFMSSLSNIKQNIVKMIVTFSSISQMSWVLMSMSNTNLWQTFLFFYSILILYCLKIMEMTKKEKEKKMMLIIFLTMSGLPPFFMFFPKILILNEMVTMNLNIIAMLLLMMSLVDLFIYMQLNITLLFKKENTMKWKMSKKMFSLMMLNFLFPVFLL